jgi:hypothetical protein
MTQFLAHLRSDVNACAYHERGTYAVGIFRR